MALSLLKILEPFWLFNFHLFQASPNPLPQSRRGLFSPKPALSLVALVASCPAPESRAELTFLMFFDFFWICVASSNPPRLGSALGFHIWLFWLFWCIFLTFLCLLPFNWLFLICFDVFHFWFFYFWFVVDFSSNPPRPGATHLTFFDCFFTGFILFSAFFWLFQLIFLWGFLPAQPRMPQPACSLPELDLNLTPVPGASRSQPKAWPWQQPAPKFEQQLAWGWRDPGTVAGAG